MKIGYIIRHDLKLNPHLTNKFEFRVANFTRHISNKRDIIRSKLLARPFDYEEIVENAKMMKGNSGIIIVGEPFLLDDELLEKCTRWVEWANKADESDYDPFARKAGKNENS